MLLNSVIIILREVLEAALIISVLSALSQKLHVSRKWLIIALLSGLIGAITYAINIKVVSMALDGVGQEVINASLHLLIYSFIVLLILSLKDQSNHRLMVFAMVSSVAIAVVREGSEIIVYIDGFISSPELLLPIIIGSAVGAGLGISIGVLFYYLIVNISLNRAVKVGLIILILIAGGMVSQAMQLLIQADFIISQQPLWDSSSLINERSLLGQLLYALIGYESTPAPIQFFCYAISLIITIILTTLTIRSYQQRPEL
ncbi:MAG: FTR1 family protein [Gammaproteobacteria bacterium]|nr:FTR1 family protein [Gammaproteobacteria bacterium]